MSWMAWTLPTALFFIGVALMLVILAVGSVSPRPVPDGVLTARATILDKTERTEALPSSTRLIRCAAVRVHLESGDVTGDACRYVWGGRWEQLAIGDEVEVIYVEADLSGDRLERVDLRD